MNVKELKEILSQYPDDMEIWVSDKGYVEGGERLTKVQKILASDAGLDGDDVSNEYILVEDDTNILEYLAKGYILEEGGEYLSKEILYLNHE